MKVFINIIILTLYIFNISNGQIVFSPYQKSTTQVNSLIMSGIIHQNTAIIGATTQGVQIYDIQDIENPKILHSFKLDGAQATKVTLYEALNGQQFYLIAYGQEGICLLHKQNDYIYQCLKIDYIVQSTIQVRQQYIISIGAGKISLIQVNISNINVINLKLLKTWVFDKTSYFQITTDSEQRFAFIAQDQNGVGIYNIDSIIALQQDPFILHVPFFESTFDLVVTKDDKYIYVIDVPQGLYICDITKLYTQTNLQQGDLVGQELLQTQSLPNSIYISNDNTLLFLGIRTYGIQIFDIQDKMNIKLLENLGSNGYSYSIHLSEDKNHILFCNGNQFKIYEQLKPNYNKDFPNIFRDEISHFIGLEREITVDGNTYFEKNIGSPWRIQVDSQDKFLYIAGARSGTQIWDISNPDQPKFIKGIDVSNINSAADGIAITTNYLYIGESWTGVKIYDIQDKSNIFQVGETIQLNGDSDDIQITLDENFMFVANGSSGITSLNINSKYNPYIIGEWNTEQPGLSVENLVIGKNESVLFASYRYYGLIILDISNKAVPPKFISEYQTGMCEYASLSIDYNTIYLSDGTQGITILNVQDPTKLKLIGQVQLDGFPTKCRIINYGLSQYLMVATRDKELLSVINITDINDSFLFAKINHGLELGYDLDITKNKQYCYMVTSKGLRIIPMKSDSTIHSEFLMAIQNDGEQNLKQNGNNSILYIGQQVQLQFVPIGIGRSIIIEKIKFYNNFVFESQPFWMELQQQSKSIVMNIDKQGLVGNANSENKLIFTYFKSQIFDTDFISTNVSQENSILIYEDLQEAGYLDSQGMVTSQYSYNKQFLNLQQNFYTEQIYYEMQNILYQTIHIIPVKFTISNSLFFNQNVKNIQNSIKSISDYFIIDIELEDTNKAVFVDKVFTKSIVILNSQKNQLTIEGPKKSTLITLYEDLRIQPKITDYDEIKLKLTINDKINRQIEKNGTLAEYPFLKIHEGIQLIQDLQEQFNNVFEEGNIEIDEDFSFQFSDTTFQSPSNLNLEFTFLIEEQYDSGDFNPIPQDYWVVANPPDRRISGHPSPTSVYQKMRVKVIATDGYVEVEDIFLIKIWNWSLFYVVIQVMEVGGPFMLVFGLYSYRYDLYALICKRFYQYSHQEVLIGQKFMKIIPIMRNSLEQGKQLLQILIKNQKLFWDSNGNFYENKILQFLDDIDLNKYKKIIHKQNINIHDLKTKSSRLYQVLIGLGALYTIQQHKITLKVYEQLKKQSIQNKFLRLNYLDWYLVYVEIDYQHFNTDQTNIFPLIKINEKLLDVHIKKSIQLLEQQQKNQKNVQQILNFQDFNLELIKKCLIAETQGTQLEKIIFPMQSKGIVLHCQEYELDKIQAYHKINEHSCLNDGFQLCGLSSNQPLPSWLDVHIQNGCIVMQGTPRDIDRGLIKIHIYLDCECIVREFYLNVCTKSKQQQNMEWIQNDLRTTKLDNLNIKFQNTSEIQMLNTQFNKKSFQDFENTTDNKNRFDTESNLDFKSRVETQQYLSDQKKMEIYQISEVGTPKVQEFSIKIVNDKQQNNQKYLNNNKKQNFTKDILTTNNQNINQE